MSWADRCLKRAGFSDNASEKVRCLGQFETIVLLAIHILKEIHVDGPDNSGDQQVHNHEV
jgi:hypothetical protein